MLVAAASATLTMSFAACDRGPPPPPVVAEIGEDLVRLTELEAELDRVRKEAGAGHVAVDAADQDALRKAVLEQLIDRRLLLAEAIRRGLSVDDRELEEAIRRRIAAREPGHDEVDDRQSAAEPGVVQAVDRDSQRLSYRSGISSTADRERLRNQLLVDRLLLTEVVSRVALGPDDAREWYDAHPEEFELDEQVRCQQILVPEKETAEALRKEISRGAGFSDLAREHSTTPDARDGGDLGFFPRGTMPQVIEDNCFELRQNQLSEVIESPYGGFHLFRRTGHRPASALAFEEVKEAIELRLTRESVARAQAAYLERLRTAAGIVVHEEVLAGRPSAP